MQELIETLQGEGSSLRLKAPRLTKPGVSIYAQGKYARGDLFIVDEGTLELEGLHLVNGKGVWAGGAVLALGEAAVRLRRVEIRGVALLANIDSLAPHGAPEQQQMAR